MSDEYAQLKVAVQDLLSELRIDPRCLQIMAEGYSPDYPGSSTWNDEFEGTWTNPHCKVQLSQVVAQKLIAAGVAAGLNPKECAKIDSAIVTNISGGRKRIPGTNTELEEGASVTIRLNYHAYMLRPEVQRLVDDGYIRVWPHSAYTYLKEIRSDR
jgi:hypothetical protein